MVTQVTASRFIVLMAMALACCPSARAKNPKSDQGSAKSGIEGTVLLGPACPGPVRLDRPCPDKPYKAVLVIKRVPDQKTVAQAESDENGRFHIALPPGRYLISNAPGPKYPSINSPEVVVQRNRFTRIEIHADTGMR